MRKRKVTTLFAVSFLLVFGKQNAEAADSTNYSSISSDNKGDVFHYGLNHIYPENSELVYLRRMVNKMKKDPTLKLKITSHGCSIGTDDANMRVSRLRANILEDYMMRHDIPKSRLVKEWKGEEEPLADNDSEHGRSINRRSLVQLIRDNGEIEPGVNKPKAQLNHASNNDAYAASSQHKSSSINHYASTHSSSSSYTQNSHSSVAQSHNNSSYSNPRNITSNTYTSNIQQPRIQNNATTTYTRHQPASGNIRTSSPVYSSTQHSTSAPLSSNSHVSSQQPIHSNHAASNHQNTTQYADTRLSQSSPVTSHSANSVDKKYHPITDDRIVTNEPAKKYVDINVEEVYKELNPDLESKQGFEYQTAEEVNEAKYHQLADALSPETDEGEALSFSENVITSSPNTNIQNNTSSRVLSDVSSTNQSSVVSKPSIQSDTRKINQPKPKPILVSKTNENNTSSNQGVEEIVIDNSASNLSKKERSTSIISDTNISSIKRENAPIISEERIIDNNSSISKSNVINSNSSHVSNAAKEMENIAQSEINSSVSNNNAVSSNANNVANKLSEEEQNISILGDTNINKIERENAPIILEEKIIDNSNSAISFTNNTSNSNTRNVLNKLSEEERNASILGDTNISKIEREDATIISEEKIINNSNSVVSTNNASKSNSSNVSNVTKEMKNAVDTKIDNSASIINTETRSTPITNANNNIISNSNTSNNVAINNAVKTNENNNIATTTTKPATSNVSSSRPADNNLTNNKLNTSNSTSIRPNSRPNTIFNNSSSNNASSSNNNSSNIRTTEPQNAASIQMPTTPARPTANTDSEGRILKTIRFIDEDSGLPIQGEIDIKTPSGILTLTSNANGEIQIPSTASNKGEADIFAYGYFYQNETIDKTNNKQTFKLKRVANGNKIALKNLFFQSGTSDILPASFPELERLYQSMISNPDIKVEVGGHINVPFTRPEDITTRQQQISVDRAKAVYEYLKSKGIPKNRLEYKGYGNSEMVFPQAQSDAEKTQNRRVEIKIIR